MTRCGYPYSNSLNSLREKCRAACGNSSPNPLNLLRAPAGTLPLVLRTRSGPLARAGLFAEYRGRRNRQGQSGCTSASPGEAAARQREPGEKLSPRRREQSVVATAEAELTTCVALARAREADTPI